MWSHLDIVVHAAMLEEELRVTPEGADLVGARGDPADKVPFAALLRRSIEGEDFEHDGVHRDDGELVLEVILILISPSIDIIWFDINLVWPVRVFLLLSILIKLGDLHDGSGTDVISDSG